MLGSGDRPAISIIVPLYNAEKYIGECLDSILAQTFKNYEVIVVDDCSTDNSCKVVESYLPKFNGGGYKLIFLRSEKNSGSCPGIPRNTGVRFSCGEYLMFVDSDDGIVQTALEESYSVAKKFDADIVYFTKHHSISQDKYSEFYSTTQIRDFSIEDSVEIVSDKIDERVQALAANKFSLVPWKFLFRRHLILKNNITFPALRGGEDSVFDFHSLMCAKTIVRTSKSIYIHRSVDGSHSKMASLPPADVIHRYGSVVMKEVAIYEEVMNQFDFFAEHPEYKYAFLDYIIRIHLEGVLRLYTEISAARLDPFIRKELSDIKDTTALTAFLFNRMNALNVQLNHQGALIQQMNAYIQNLQAYIKQIQTQLHK